MDKRIIAGVSFPISQQLETNQLHRWPDLTWGFIFSPNDADPECGPRIGEKSGIERFWTAEEEVQQVSLGRSHALQASDFHGHNTWLVLLNIHGVLKKINHYFINVNLEFWAWKFAQKDDVLEKYIWRIVSVFILLIGPDSKIVWLFEEIRLYSRVYRLKTGQVSKLIFLHLISCTVNTPTNCVVWSVHIDNNKASMTKCVLYKY